MVDAFFHVERPRETSRLHGVRKLISSSDARQQARPARKMNVTSDFDQTKSVESALHL